MFADAVGAGLHSSAGVSGYGAGDTPAPLSTAPTARGPSASRADFEVQNWAASRNTSLESASLGGMQVGVSSGGIHAHAQVRALTSEAQGYSTGFVQTMHHSTRRAVYTDGTGAVVNTYVASRGSVLDQRTDISSPVPWYNYGVHLGATARQPSMSDNPTWVVPTYSPEFGVPARMEGSESFTTYLVVMVGNDSSTIIYLGNVRWNVNWQGRFDAARHFHGHDATVGAASSSADGAAVLSGPAANEGSMGAFTGGA